MTSHIANTPINHSNMNNADTPLAPGVVRNPRRMSGRATVEGTRITVANIMRRLAAGQTIDDVRTDYPHLTRQHILNALGYATQLVEANDPPPFDIASLPDAPAETVIEMTAAPQNGAQDQHDEVSR